MLDSVDEFLAPRLSPSLIHGLCAIFASSSRFVRLFEAALDTCLDSPFFASLSVHGLHFTVYTPSIKAFDWAMPPVRLGLSGRNSRKIPERPRKRSQSVSWNFPREYGWDAPNPLIQGI